MARETGSDKRVMQARGALLVSGAFYVLVAFEFLYMASPAWPIYGNHQVPLF